LKFSRRQFLGMTASFAVVAGLASLADVMPNHQLVRPPGAISEDLFPESCIRCGACADACPVHGISLGHLTDGLRNIGTPVLTGYCMVYRGLEKPSPESAMAWRKNARAHGQEVRCYDCVNACPSNALQKSNAVQLHLGTAVVKKEYCRAYRFGNCQFPCKDVCPYDAISVTVGPVVDEAKCVGCGQCDYVCLARLIGPTGIVVERTQRQG
jgi:ferredoxin-type protein NapG